MDDSAIMCDETIESFDDETNFSEKKKSTCKTQNFNILPAFILITIALLILVFTAVSIYCYLIKYRRKQSHLLPFHFKNSKFKKMIY